MKLKKLLKKDEVEGAVKSKELTEQLQLQLEEHKKMEQRLLQAAQQWRTIFDAISDMVCFLDPEGRILRCNKAMANFLRKPFSEILNRPYWEIVHGTTAPIKECPVVCMKETRHRETAIFPMGDRWFNIAVDPLLNEAGCLVGAVHIMSDITERKQAEEEAEKLAQENAIMAEIGRVISSTLNIEEVYERFAEEVNKLILFDRIVINMIDMEKNTFTNVYMTGKGVSDRETGKTHPLDGSSNAEMVRTKSTFLIQAEDFNEYRDHFPMLLSTFQAGIRSIMNVPLFSKGQIIGGLLLRSLKPYAYTDKDVSLAERVADQIAGAVANAQLFIERNRAEEERNALQEQLHQSQKMETIGQLAGGVAHDFNNLLTVIRGYTDLLLNSIDPNNPLYPDTIEIKNASEKAESLTRQLLVFSRKQTLQSKVLDLNTLVSNMDKMLQRLIGEDIQLVTVLAEGLGKIKADPCQIEQMIINLAVNARDAMLDGGKLTVETAHVMLDEHYTHTHIIVTPGPYVMLSISDSGIGMTQEIKERIFEPFFTTKGEGKGTGLGLSTVYGIVKQSGGNILVYSEPGHGTTFKIYLPRVDEDLESLGPTEVSTESLEGSETILLVEDEEVVRRVVVAILQNRGYTVLEAMNGEEALRLVQEHNGNPIDLVVTDVVMPKMSGLRLAKYLLALYHEIKVLYMSGYTDNALIHQEILKPQMPYIQKPFTSEGLARKVREVLDGHS